MLAGERVGARGVRVPRYGVNAAAPRDDRSPRGLFGQRFEELCHDWLRRLWRAFIGEQALLV